VRFPLSPHVGDGKERGKRGETGQKRGHEDDGDGDGDRRETRDRSRRGE
jgi:hypothetical protein